MDCRSPRVAGGSADVNTGLAGFLAGPSACEHVSGAYAVRCIVNLSDCYKYRLSVKHGGCVYVECERSDRSPRQWRNF